MSPPSLENAIIAAMQDEPDASQLVIRKKVGATEYHFAEAVKRLRWAGTLPFGKRFTLSPSMQKISPPVAQLPTAAGKAKEGAGNARRGKRAVPDRSQPDCVLPGPSIVVELPAEPTAFELMREIRAFQHKSGMSRGTFTKRCGLSGVQMRKIESGDAALRMVTVNKVRAVIASGGRPSSELGFGLAFKETRLGKMRAAVRHDEERDQRAMSRQASETRQPGESIADRFRRLAAEADEEELAAIAAIDAQERRERDLDRLASPSAVLRLAQRDWPKQCIDVGAIAKELGISLGECWRRVIKAGVDCLREAGDEGVAA